MSHSTAGLLGQIFTLIGMLAGTWIAFTMDSYSDPDQAEDEGHSHVRLRLWPSSSSKSSVDHLASRRGRFACECCWKPFAFWRRGQLRVCRHCRNAWDTGLPHTYVRIIDARKRRGIPI
jgi:hypothetical protein